MARWFLFLLTFVLFSSQAQAGLGVAGRAGTQGIGGEATLSLMPMVNVRGGGYFFSYAFDGTKSDVSYDLDLKLRSFALLLDVHPAPLLGFRVSGGLIINKNRVDMVGVPQGSYRIGDQTYSGDEVGTVLGDMEFRTSAPYLGIGWGNAAARRVGLAFDLGIVFQGEPDVTLRATGPISADPTFRAELAKEEAEIQDDAGILKNYPVVSIGLSFKLPGF